MNSLLVKSTSRALIGAALLTCWIVAPHTSRAERGLQVGGGINPESFYGKDPTAGVYVRDSTAALEKIALAQKMERLKDWAKSADLYQEVLEKFGDRVVPSQVGKDNQIYQYTSVANGVIQKLAKWPREGLDVYRSRYEATATSLLEAAGNDNVYALNQIFSRYFVTDGAKTAALRLLDLKLERGEFTDAMRIGSFLLEWHPNLLVERPAVLYRTALAAQLGGDPDRAVQYAQRLKKDFPDEKGMVRGRDVVLAESLEQELKDAGPLVKQGTGPDSWPMFYGGPDRSRISTAEARPGAKLFSVPLAKPDYKDLQPEQKKLLDQQAAQPGFLYQNMGIMPVTDHNELFFQDGRRIYAVSLESGAPLPGWAQANGDRGGQYVLPNASGAASGHQLTITLTDRDVLAVMGQFDSLAILRGIPVPNNLDSRLVCLDRATGKERWVTSMSQVKLPEGLKNDEAASIRALQLTGSPLVIGDGVLVAGRSTKQGNQFEDCWVVCLDVNSGQYRWSSYIASMSNTNFMFNLGGMPGLLSNRPAQLSYADGRVYVLTNVGAVAALDAYNGTIAWLNIYARGQEFGRNRMIGGNPGGATVLSKPWTPNPVIIEGGRLFVLPSDARDLLIYEAATGVEQKRVKLSHLENADTILGVIGERLFLGSNTRFFCLKWKEYDPENYDPDKMLAWGSAEVKAKEIAPNVPKVTIIGRPFLTGDSVFVCTDERMVRHDLSTGKARDAFPNWPRSWEEGDGPGNILVTSDHMIIAGSSHVDVYTELTAARRRLDREIAAAPDDPTPRLRYAELMFAADQSDVAVGKLDEATALLGGAGALRAGPIRDRIFYDALTFAQRLATTDSSDSAKRANGLFDRAAAAAANSAQQVRYRLARAKFAAAGKDAVAAAQLYQEILSDPQMRPEPIADENGPTQAGAFAEKALKRLLEQAGPEVYAKFEQLANAALADARASKDGGKLLTVALIYPNSSVAPQAMLSAAEAYEQSDKPQLAIQVMRQMYFKYPDSPHKAAVLESLARNYLTRYAKSDQAGPSGAATAMDMLDAAMGMLSNGAQLSGSPRLQHALKLPDGTTLQNVTFAQALEALRKFNGQQASRNLPDFHLPLPSKTGEMPEPFLPHTPDSVIPDVFVLATPLREYARVDRVVAWSPEKGLSIYQPGQTKPLATSNALTEAPRNVAWVGDNLVVWGLTEVALIPGRGGDPSWKLQLANLPGVEVVKLPDAPAAPPQPADAERARRALRGARLAPNPPVDLRGAVGVAMAPAAELPPAPNAPEQISTVLPVGERVLFSTTTGRLASLELSSGRVAWQNRLAERPLDRLVANEDFAAVRLSDDSGARIVALDTYTGQIRGTKAFNPQTGLVPVNLALAPEGTLVYTMPDRLCLKDLYKPWAEPELEIPAAPGQMPYAGASAPDQLIVAGGRILTVADSAGLPGSPGEKYVRVHSLETGKPLTLKYNKDGNEGIDRVLRAGTKTWNVTLRIVGSQLYVINERTVTAYNLDHPAETWSGVMDDDPAQTPHVRDVFIGQKFVVLLNQPTSGIAVPAANIATSYRLPTYGRYPSREGSTAESGRLDYLPLVEDASGITTWQAVEGGFYYLAGDHNLHMLRGSAK